MRGSNPSPLAPKNRQQYGVSFLESVPEANLEGVESPYLRKFRIGQFRNVASRVHNYLSRMSLWREKRGLEPFRSEAMEKSAALVGEYHVWRHTPRIDRDEDWPKNKKKFCEGYGVSVEQLDHVLTMVRHHRWEKEFLAYTSPEVRIAMVKDVLLQGAVRQTEADPGKENANLLRTALQADGELKGTQKITQVNVGSNVLNLPENLTAEDLRARLDRVNRLAETLKAREVPHTEVPNEP